MPVKSDERRRSDPDFIRVDEEAFRLSGRVGRLRGHGTHGRCQVVVPMDAGWSDVGLGSSLWEIAPTPPRATFATAM